ncbi:MAG: hypothetical protein ABII97_02140 [Patescibacteria group bacterium]
MFKISKKQKIFTTSLAILLFGFFSFSGVGAYIAVDSELDDAVGLYSEEEYVPGTFAQYATQTLKFAITIGALLAIIIIIIGGFEYVTAGGNTGQVEKAKERITQAILGLILIVGSYLILYTINPDLVNLNLGLDPLEIPPPPTTPIETYQVQTTSALACEQTCVGSFEFDPATKNCTCSGPIPNTFKTCFCDRNNCYTNKSNCPLFMGEPNCFERAVPTSRECN